MKKDKEEIINKRFSKLVVKQCLGKVYRKDNIKYETKYECLCDCGNIKIVSYSDLVNNNTKSCGCLIVENARRTIKFAHEANKLPKGKASFNSIYATYKKSAENRNLTFNLTEEHCHYIFQTNCYYCNQIPVSKRTCCRTNGTYAYNGIDRIDNSRGYEFDNVVACCSTCNWMKQAFSKDDFLKKIKDIYSHRINKIEKRTVESDLRLIIKTLLERCAESDLNMVNSGNKSLEQHEKDCKDIYFYIQLLDKEGGMKNLPSKYAELALGKFKMLLNVYKEL